MQSPIETWQSTGIDSDGSETREACLELRGRSHGYCVVTGLSLALSDRVIRVGDDIYVAADLVPGLDAEHSTERLARQIDAITRRERRIAEIKSALTDIEGQMQSLKTEQWELQGELREIRNAM